MADGLERGREWTDDGGVPAGSRPSPAEEIAAGARRRYRTIVADPPWPIAWRYRAGHDNILTEEDVMERQEREQDQQGVGGPLREEDVTAGDRLDDRVSEGEGLPEPGGETSEGGAA